MSKTATTALLNHLASETTTLTVNWLLKLNFRTYNITGITQANPAVVTVDIPHGLSTGDQISIEDVVGMTEVNDDLHGGSFPGENWLFHTITVLSTTTFSLDGVDSSAYTAYSSGGTFNQVYGFTILDNPVEMHGITYRADRGISDTAVRQNQDLSVDNLEIEGIMSFLNLQNAISAKDIEAGRLDFAELRVMLVNYESVSDGFMWIKRGWLGDVDRDTEGRYLAKVRGISEAAQQQTLEVTSPSCRYDFGSTRCGFDVSTVTETGTVTSVTDNAVFADSSRTEADNHFRYGLLTWTVGNNAGLQQEVKTYVSATDTFTLYEAMPEDIEVGDQYSVYQGCDKSLDTCVDEFSNGINFGGEPYLPGEDFLVQFVIPSPPDVTTD